ncbi:aminopeptidase [Shimazuella kribbensis]|uniref:aminopeptidase n=1 Tax=Shimazuella kribbensis TaxID=139808 RepID=UPI00040310FF|nr:aminopeptidase [Shimazuella kribbensis]
MSDSVEICVNVLKDCLALQKEELFLVVTDEKKADLAQHLYQAGRKIGAESMLLLMEEREKSGQEPPVPVAEAMKKADAVVCITEHSLTHTIARKEAVATGTRVATMPGITADMFYHGAITANYQQVKVLTEKITAYLEKSTEVRIEKDGETLTFSIAGRHGIASTGVLTERGDSGNLPSGEAFIAPLEGTASGKIKVDGSVADIGILHSPLWLTIEEGRLVEVEGEAAEQLLTLLHSDESRQLAEFGIGTNNKARITGVVLEDEKVYGTIHLAFGSNVTFGGQIEAGVHIDLVIKEPDVYLDGEKFMDKGIPMVD